MQTQQPATVGTQQGTSHSYVQRDLFLIHKPIIAGQNHCLYCHVPHQSFTLLPLSFFSYPGFIGQPATMQAQQPATFTNQQQGINCGQKYEFGTKSGSKRLVQAASVYHGSRPACVVGVMATRYFPHRLPRAAGDIRAAGRRSTAPFKSAAVSAVAHRTHY